MHRTILTVSEGPLLLYAGQPHLPRRVGSGAVQNTRYPELSDGKLLHRINALNFVYDDMPYKKRGGNQVQILHPFDTILQKPLYAKYVRNILQCGELLS